MRRASCLVLVSVALWLAPSPALAAEITVSELLERGDELDGGTVTLEGELIGDYGVRDDGSMWTQLNDDVYVRQPIAEGGRPAGANIGIGVRIPVGLTGELGPPGGYRHRGPVVRVTGLWKYHDSERRGESYLEVSSLTIAEPGRHLDQDASWVAISAGGLLLAGAGITAWLTRAGRGRPSTRDPKAD